MSIIIFRFGGVNGLPFFCCVRGELYICAGVFHFFSIIFLEYLARESTDSLFLFVYVGAELYFCSGNSLYFIIFYWFLFTQESTDSFFLCPIET